MNTDFKVLMTLMGLEIGGAETHVLELCKALKRRGVDVYAASNGGAYEHELQALGIPHFHVPLHNKKPASLITAYRSLRKIIIENDIHLVHAHGRIPAFLCGVLHKHMRFRFVTTAHLNFKTSFPYNILSDWGEKSLAVSEDIKDYLIKNYRVPEDDIRITINGIDTDKFRSDIDYSDIEAELGLEKGKLRIVSHSRMDKDRSLVAHRLIECAEDFYNHNKNIEIIIVGGGDDFENVKHRASAINKKLGQEIVHLTGNRVDVNKFVAMADIYINVSRSVLEAMASERACIVAGNQGYIGIFDESRLKACEETNFCCRGCGDTTRENVKRDILALMDKTPEERAELGAFGRKIIMENYSLDRMASDSLNLYELVRNQSPDRPNDVLISGYYGFKNNGDEAVLKAIIDSLLLKDDKLSITVLSMRPKLTSELYNVKSINRYNIFKIWSQLKRTNLLITGGGSLIQDLTSTRSLFYYLLVIRASITRGAKSMLFANGIGPLNLEKNKRLVTASLNKVDLITVRDEHSAAVLNELNVTKPPIHLTADIVFCMKESSSVCARLEKIGLRPGEKYFCVAIRNWKNIKDDFESKIAALSDYISGKYGMVPVLIPMQPSTDEDISKRSLSLMKNAGYFFGTDYDLNEVLSAVAGAELVVGMRLHTIIYAAKAGVPVIGLVYDPKVKVVMEMLKQRFFMNVEELELDTLKGYVDEILTNRAEISSEVLLAAEAAKERGLRNADLAYELLRRPEF